MSFRLPLSLILAAALFSAAGCSRFEKAPAPLTRRVAVLDFRAPRNLGKQPVRVDGYWMGADTVFENDRDGIVFADALAEAFVSLEYLVQHSRADVRYYMKTKRRLLMEKFKNLKTEEYERLLGEVSPLDYALELGVDEVVTGRVVESYMTEGRVLHTWSSYIKVEVDVWDVSAGEVVWSGVFDMKKRFTSKPMLMRKLAVEVADRLDAKFYRKQSR